MRASYRTGIACVVALAAMACLDDTPSGVEAPSIRLSLVAQVGGGPNDRSIEIRVFYRRTNEEEVVLPSNPSRVTVAAGTTTTHQVVVQVGACLRDPLREDANRPGCTFRVELRLLDANGTLLSRDVQVTGAPILPGQTARLPQFNLPGLGFGIAPTAVTFSAQRDAALPAPATVVITPNVLGTPLGQLSSTAVFAPPISPWLRHSISQAPGQPAELTLQPTTTLLAPGTYGATVTVTSSLGGVTPRVVTVTYNVSPVPQLALTTTLTGSGSGTVASSPAGINCVLAGGSVSGNCTANFDQNTVVTVTATPTGGSSVALSGSCTGTTSCQVTMSQARSVTATFTAPPRPLTITAATGSTGTGAITSNPSGIACNISGTALSGTCTQSFPHGTVVTLNRDPTGGSTFLGWGGACSGLGSCQVTMDQARSVTASFAAQRTLTVTAATSSTGIGTVTSNPTGITCTVSGTTQTGQCSQGYVNGTAVTLTAQESPNHTFAGWGGACASSGTNRTCTLTMNQNLSVTASFTAPPPRTLRLLPPPSGANGVGVVRSQSGLTPAINCTVTRNQISGACTQNYPLGTVVVLTATPNPASNFSGWSGACSGTGQCTLTMSVNRDVTARFDEPIP